MSESTPVLLCIGTSEMSLQDNKNALFGKGPSPAPSGTKKPTSNTSPSTSSKMTPIPKPSSSISPEMKAKKVKEGNENEERAQKFLKTSVRISILMTLLFYLPLDLSMES
jgi:hypothetical protein